MNNNMNSNFRYDPNTGQPIYPQPKKKQPKKNNALFYKDDNNKVKSFVFISVDFYSK